MVRFEPTHPRKQIYSLPQLSNFAASPLYWSEYKDSNLGPPGPKPGALPDCATLRILLAPQAGIEPTTNWLTANCTTAVLLWNYLVAGPGIAPRTEAYETSEILFLYPAIIRLDLQCTILMTVQMPRYLVFLRESNPYTKVLSVLPNSISSELIMDPSSELGVETSEHKFWRSQGDSNPC